MRRNDFFKANSGNRGDIQYFNNIKCSILGHAIIWIFFFKCNSMSLHFHSIPMLKIILLLPHFSRNFIFFFILLYEDIAMNCRLRHTSVWTQTSKKKMTATRNHFTNPFDRSDFRFVLIKFMHSCELLKQKHIYRTASVVKRGHQPQWNLNVWWITFIHSIPILIIDWVQTYWFFTVLSNPQ